MGRKKNNKPIPGEDDDDWAAINEGIEVVSNAKQKNRDAKGGKATQGSVEGGAVKGGAYGGGRQGQDLPDYGLTRLADEIGGGDADKKKGALHTLIDVSSEERVERERARERSP